MPCMNTSAAGTSGMSAEQSPTTTLKACPFCGGSAKMLDWRVAEDAMECVVECQGCGARTEAIEGAYSERPAAAAWNRRTSP